MLLPRNSSRSGRGRSVRSRQLVGVSVGGHLQQGLMLVVYFTSLAFGLYVPAPVIKPETAFESRMQSECGGWNEPRRHESIVSTKTMWIPMPDEKL